MTVSPSKENPNEDEREWFEGAAGEVKEIMANDDEDEDIFKDDAEWLFGGSDDESGGPVVEGSVPRGVGSGHPGELDSSRPEQFQGEDVGGEGAEMDHYHAANQARRDPAWRRRRFAQKRQRRVVRKPQEPTKQQREEHDLSHIPKEDWCPCQKCGQSTSCKSS